MLLIAGLALIGLVGEAWLRATVLFVSNHRPLVFVPDMGLMLPPDTEVRWTNRLDFWTVSRTNLLGFLDREPPSLERAAESCHIAVIGGTASPPDCNPSLTPSEFRFHGGILEIGRQTDNAVPPVFALYIGKTVRQYCESD